MPILLIANTKGGCGKSTVATNIATVLSRNYDVMLLDADRQTSSSEWWATRKQSYPDHPKIACVQKRGDIADTLLDFDKRYQFVIVDVAGDISDEMDSALEVCDKVLMPFRPSTYDLSALPTNCKLLHKAKRYNKNLQAYALLSIAPTNPVIKEIQYARECILEYDEIVMLNSVLSERKVYRDTAAMGLGVCETTGRDSEASARKEVNDLVNEVLNNG
jgi:chromosome partitioning protein